MKIKHKIGDRVKCIKPRNTHIIKDNFYYIIDIDSISSVKLSNEKNGEPISIFYFAFNQFELVEEEENDKKFEWMI